MIADWLEQLDSLGVVLDVVVGTHAVGGILWSAGRRLGRRLDVRRARRALEQAERLADDPSARAEVLALLDELERGGRLDDAGRARVAALRRRLQ